MLPCGLPAKYHSGHRKEDKRDDIELHAVLIASAPPELQATDSGDALDGVSVVVNARVIHNGKRRGVGDMGEQYVTCTLADLVALITGARP